MRKSLLSAVCAVSLAAAATLPSGSQARGITVAVGSSFTTLDPYQATDLLSPSRSTKGFIVSTKISNRCLSWLNRMK